MAVLHPKTEAVVFSIDGSFLASYSLRGVDPKIRGGAVDVVRSVSQFSICIINWFRGDIPSLIELKSF